MKKWISGVLAVLMLITMLPMSTLAFDQYVVYSGQAGCQLTSWSIPKADNPWLMNNITFETQCDGRVWVTADAHPYLVGAMVVPSFTYEGDRLTFNGQTIAQGDSVALQAENELVVYGGSNRAEYQISVTEESNGLPVVLIDTNGKSIPDKVNYVDAKISVLGAEIYGGNDILAAVAGIKLRGNSTAGYDKKPYRIKFDKKQDVFGLGKAKSWVLLANYLDPAAMRNDIAYAFGSRLSTLTEEKTGFSMYVPRVRPVEVYLNGQYRGLYDMGDHVQVDGTRIDIDDSGDEFDDNDVQVHPEANVGYYLEIEDSSRVLEEYEKEGAAYFTINNTGGSSLDTLYVQVKTPEVPSAAQLNYIKQYVQTVNDLINARDARVWDYIEMDGFIDWYLVNEVFKNTDSGFLSSVKLFKDKDGKLSMGPVWDFDLGSGAVAYSDIDEPNGWRTRVDDRCAWYKNLFKMSDFSNAVNARWADLHNEGIIDGIFADIDALESYLEKAANRNYDYWHESYVSAVNNTSWLYVPDIQMNSTNWETQVDYLRTYMKGRIAWIDEQFGYAPVSGAAISGEAVIIGAPEYRETLYALPLAVEPYGASLKYQWYADGAAISGATNSTFTPAKEYIGKSIHVVVTGRSGYSGSLTSEPIVLEYTRKTSATSQIPPLVSKTHDTVVVLERTGYDISIDGGITWQKSGTFTGLEPNTLYRVVYRHENNIDYCKPGQPGKPLYVITDVDPNEILVGDATLDGMVNMRDALLAYQAASRRLELSGDALVNADIDGNGTISMRDALAVYHLASKI